MGLNLTSSNRYDMFSLDGELTIGSLVGMTSELSKHIQTLQAKDLVLNLSSLSFLDSSGIRFFVNVRKRMEQKGRRMFLLNPSEQVRTLIHSVNLDKVLTVIDSVSALEQEVAANVYERYVPFTEEENGLRRLQCRCPVCGSDDIAGYLLDQNAYQWQWEHGAVFPTSIHKKSGEELDIPGLQPIVCLDCFMASTTLREFTIVDGKKTAFQSVMDDATKLLLSKSIKKRKKMMEIGVAIGDNFFLHPRDPKAKYQAYRLAEFCARAIILDRKSSVSAFSIGYLNYCAIKYAEAEQKDELINNCRTWLTQALNHADSMNHLERAMAYFILLIADINLGKIKEAGEVRRTFNGMIDSIDNSGAHRGVMNPHFWHEQALALWEQEIEEQSSIVKASG